jgi:hypothetical protein
MREAYSKEPDRNIIYGAHILPICASHLVRIGPGGALLQGPFKYVKGTVYSASWQIFAIVLLLLYAASHF